MRKFTPCLQSLSAALLFGGISITAIANSSVTTAATGDSDDSLKKELQILRERIERLETQGDASKSQGNAGATPRTSGGIRVGDGLIWEDASGNATARLTARGMFDYRNYLDSDAKADTFSVRRARLGLGFNINKSLGGFVETELAFGNATNAGSAATAGLLQGFVEWSPTSAARLRIGQIKPQFTLEGTSSPFHIEFQERSLMFNLLQNFVYDRGLMVHGSPLAGTYYALSYTNGTGVNIDEFQRNATEAAEESKDITARLVADAAPWMGLSRTVLHLGASYKTGEVANGDASTAGYTAANGITEARGIVFFNPASFNPGSALAAPSVDRSIGGIEMALARGAFKLQAEVARASYAGTLVAGDEFERDITAGYVSFSWVATGESFSETYRNGVFGRIRPAREATLDDLFRGAWQASLRYSFFDGDDFQAGNPALTGQLGGNSFSPAVTRSSAGADAWTLALKWMPTANFALMLNYVRTDFDTPVTANGNVLAREDAITLRTQFDFF